VDIEPSTIGAVSAALLPRILATPDWLFNTMFLKRWKIDDKARSSMADDLAAGRKTEIDFLNGELVRLAERLQADAPVNRKIVELVRAAEEGAKPLAPTALRKAVLG
jgi:2-dehydropantoate 2-reductase